MIKNENGHELAGGKILCLIDFSDASQQALRWATKMAETTHAYLTVLYSYRLLESKIEVIQKKKQTEVDALKKFLLWESEILNNKKIEYEFRSEVGFMADRVEAFVSQNPVRMLVIHKDMMKSSGETFQPVIDHLQVPLVLVP